MKKILLTLSLLVASFAFIACDDDDDVKISVSELPEQAQLFLQTHFASAEVNYVEKDNDSYDVYLKNGFSIEFTLTGEWDDVDGNGQEIPESILLLLPENIMAVINESYSQYIVTEISKETYVYEIELNNNLELMFQADGTFIGAKS